MDVEHLDRWFSQAQQSQMVAQLVNQVGVTRIRAECFVRLWLYLLVKQQSTQTSPLKPPLAKLTLPTEAVVCTHRESAELFYHDREQGSDRSAGMMLDKLAALGLIKKYFDGNTTRIQIQPIPEVSPDAATLPTLMLDQFDPRCDAIPIANLLAVNYNWMNRNAEAVPHRIARLLRRWASQYAVGMRVLRRCDNLNPVGFYLLYPTSSQSEANFFVSPSKGLHLSTMMNTDPFQMAAKDDLDCASIFVRSWIIEDAYEESYRTLLIKDIQSTLNYIQIDFPNLCDIYTLIIHPSYEKLALALGFQQTSRDPQSSMCWMYLALDRFLALDVEAALSQQF